MSDLDDFKSALKFAKAANDNATTCRTSSPLDGITLCISYIKKHQGQLHSEARLSSA